MTSERPRTRLASADSTLDHAVVSRLSEAGFATAQVDAQGNLTSMSPALEALLEKSFAPVHLSELAVVYGLHDSAGLTVRQESLALERALHGERVRGWLAGVRLADGSSRWLVVDAAPTSSDGVVTGACVVCSDVTHQIALVERQHRDGLAESVNHHLRTPLAVVMGHAELLSELLGDLEQRGGAAGSDGAFHLDRLTRASLQLLAAMEEVTRIIREDLSEQA